jgi:hypothetical protein
MKKITKLAAAVALSAIVLGSFSTAVSAQTVNQNQELSQTVKVNCTTGSYGQNTTCTAEGTQTGKQNQTVTIDGVTYIVRANGSRVRYHKPVNTSMDTMTISGLIAAAVTTAGAGYLTIKKSK